MTSSRSDTTAKSPFVFAPFAGSIHAPAPDGRLISLLVARHDRIAITADGRLVSIDRSSEWLDDRFSSWRAIPVEQLSADGMKNALAIVETLLALPANTLSADSLPAALKVAAASANLCLLGLQERLVPLRVDRNPA